MNSLYIVGAGGCGREVLNLILDTHVLQGPRWKIEGFLDDTEDPLRGKACDYSVVGSIIDYSPKNGDVLVLAIANPQAKRKIVSMLKSRGAVFDSIIHPHAYLGHHCTLGEGVVVFGGFVMSANVAIGNFTTLLSCSVGHDVRIADFSTISVHSNIMGNVSVGKAVFAGGSVVIAPHVTVGDEAYLCAGSVLVKDVHAGEKVLGNPARVIGLCDHYAVAQPEEGEPNGNHR